MNKRCILDLIAEDGVDLTGRLQSYRMGMRQVKRSYILLQINKGWIDNHIVEGFEVELSMVQ